MHSLSKATPDMRALLSMMSNVKRFFSTPLLWEVIMTDFRVTRTRIVQLNQQIKS